MNVSVRKLLLSAMVLIVSCLVAVAQADDWPHWMGPTRDNVWRETGIIEEFPEGGPKVVWQMDIAGGYSGPAVSQGKVVITDYQTSDDVKTENFQRKEFTGVERVLCLDETTGREVWKHEYPVKYTISYPAGPRCTPIIEGNFVYTLGAEGDLLCLAIADGSVVWQKNLREAYSTKSALWGYAAHPLIDGEHLITLAGGDGSHVVALNKATGEEVWRSGTASEQGYSPPTIIEHGGKRQLILLSPDHIRSVDPQTGREYWSVPYQATNGSIIMSPVLSGDYLYVGGYSQRSALLKLQPDATAPEVVWRDKRRVAMSPVNVQPILDGEVLYGFDQGGSLVALKLPEGERLWSTTQPVSPRRKVATGTAFLVRQGTRYWMFVESGDLVLAEMDADGFRELDRAKVIEPTNVAFGRKVVWSMPAFANRRVYLRNDEEIICLDLAVATEN